MSLPIENDTRRDIAEMVWQRVCHRFVGIPTKITTICTKRKSVVLGSLKSRDMNELSNIHVPFPDGMTFLWKFLVDEAKEFVKEDNEWIFFLISDGLDNQSRGKYRGAKGIRPCIEEIEKLGIDAEFHIIGLGLPSEVEEIFEQLSGATGGFFENITEEHQLDDSITKMDEVLEDLTIPSIRARKRLLRQREYQKMKKEGQLDLTQVNVSSIEPPEDGYLYGKVRVYRTNPERTQDWQNDLLHIRGHSDVEQVDEGEFWYQFESRADSTSQDEDKDNSWSIDAVSFSDTSTFAPSSAMGKRRGLFRRRERQQTPKSDGKIDKIFKLIQDIRASDVPAEKKQVILRGTEVEQVYIDLLIETGAKVIVYPRELPPPPPPEFDSPLWSDEAWVYFNPTLDWTQYPISHRQPIHEYGIIDPFLPKEYVEFTFKDIDVSIELDKIHAMLKDSDASFKSFQFDDDWFTIDQNDEQNMVWTDDWLDASDELIVMKELLKIAFIQVIGQFLLSKGTKSNFIVLRCTEGAKKLGLNTHPVWSKFQEYCNEFNTWAKKRNFPSITFDFWL